VYVRSKHAGCYVVPAFPIQAAAYLHTKLHGDVHVTELRGIDEFDANTLEVHEPKSRLRAYDLIVMCIQASSLQPSSRPF